MPAAIDQLQAASGDSAAALEKGAALAADAAALLVDMKRRMEALESRAHAASAALAGLPALQASMAMSRGGGASMEVRVPIM